MKRLPVGKAELFLKSFFSEFSRFSFFSKTEEMHPLKHSDGILRSIAPHFLGSILSPRFKQKKRKRGGGEEKILSMLAGDNLL